MTNALDLNRSLLDKKVDNFYVSFFNMPENISNILGRQVYSIERPSLLFNPTPIYNKGKRQQKIGNIEVAETAVIFRDDENSLVMKAIYSQLYRQTGKLSPSFENSKFEISVKVLNANQHEIESYIMKSCFISNITHSENIYTSSENNLITATISYDNVEYPFIEV